MPKWIVGQPGGPSGPFYSVVSQTGELIAMQVVSKERAEQIAGIPALAAEVEHLRSALSTLEQRWRAASQDKCFRAQFRQTMSECADSLKDILSNPAQTE